MIWIFVGLLAIAVFGVLAFVFKAPRSGWEAIGAALLLGVAGYAAQGSPGKPGAPHPPQEVIQGSSAALVSIRQKLAANPEQIGNNWQVIADALARHGQFADAAGVLLGAVEKDPKNADAWLALGNAMVGHAEGTLSPAALFAYQRASAADPSHPGPPFFLGLALAQSGRLDEGRAMWAGLLERSPKDAPWRADLAARVDQLDALIVRRNAAQKTAQ